MYQETEGIILKQIKTVNGRRMILLFTKKYGKISAGSSISEKGRGKAALAMHPFTYGKYSIYKNGGYFNISGGEVIKSYYSIGEDVDKYMNASLGLEITEKFLVEEVPVPGLFALCVDFLNLIEKREKKSETLVLAYRIKALKELGYLPNLKSCVSCGKEKKITGFSVKDGGIICEDCFEKKRGEALIFRVNFGIVDILNYFINNPLFKLEKIALEEKVFNEINNIVKEYDRYHLDLGEFKSELCLDIKK